MRGANRYNSIVVLFVSLGSFTYGFSSSIVASFLAQPFFYAYFELSLTGLRKQYTTQMVGGCSGMMDAVCPLYHSEVSPAQSRGKLVGFHAVLLICCYAVAPVILLAGSRWIPESPRWLILSDCLDEGREIIYNLRQTQEDPDNTQARLEFDRIHSQIMIDKEKAPSGRTLFTDLSVFRRLAMGFLWFLRPNQVGCWVNAMLMDRVGRIKLMCGGLIGGALALCGEAAMVARFSGTNNALGNGFGIFFLFLFITIFTGGMDAGEWTCRTVFRPSNLLSNIILPVLAS
ncbi:Major facilitator superfamily domain general substrate transporter [Penicillium longicatenatum]|nr:Major facilitator superfamily domain general substrate transporter [Penicillium longicatenatum]